MEKLRFAAGIVLSIAFVQSASAEPATPPNLSGGEGGWVHPRGTGFGPVPGSPLPVRQDPGHPFVGGQNWRIGDLTNPNLKPWVRESMKKDTDEIDAGKIAFQPSSSCVPSGIPNMFSFPNPLLILQASKEVVMIKEGGTEIRHVYLDVPHSPNPKPSWHGESVGHYDGDTLVIDTIAQSTNTVLDVYRTPHSEKLHVVERWRTTDWGERLDVEITVDDPDAFYQPWSTLVRDRRGQELFNAEALCSENNLNFGLFDFHMPVATKPDF